MDPDAADATTGDSSSPLRYSTATTCPLVGALGSEVVVSWKRQAGSPLGLVAGKVLDERQRMMTKSMDDDAAAVASLWGFILPDILGIVLRFLPCLADRAAVRSVCRHWRAAARGHSLPPPLPLLVLPRFSLFSFSTKGAVVTMRCGWMPEEVATGHVSCLGTCDGWLIGVRTSENAAGSESFLVNAFSHEIVNLPRLHAPYRAASGEHPWTANDDPKYSMSIDHVVFSAPPGSATKCIVAGISYRRNVPSLSDWHLSLGITLWRPGMKTWYVYQTRSIKNTSSDLVFQQEKLYVLQRSWYAFRSPWLFAFTLGEDEQGVNVSGHERPVNIPPILRPSGPQLWARCNLVLWRASLVLIIRYVDASISPSHTKKVDVFALDLSKDPCGVTEIHNFDGDCVFVDPCRCTSFPTGSYEGVQGDCIYFIDKKYDKYKKYVDHSCVISYVTTVYNMRDGTVKPFIADLLSVNRAEDNLSYAVWMFPS